MRYICAFNNQLMLRTYTTAQKLALYNRYDAAIWLRHYYDDASGGYVVVHRQRFSRRSISKNECAKFDKEVGMAIVFARNGYCIEMLEEISGKSSPDVRINGVSADLKYLTSHNNIVRKAKIAVRNQGASVVLFAFTNISDKTHEALNKLRSIGIDILYYVENVEVVYTL
jgi:hypothetical protein